jgi:hypothetical protein
MNPSAFDICISLFHISPCILSIQPHLLCYHLSYWTFHPCLWTIKRWSEILPAGLARYLEMEPAGYKHLLCGCKARDTWKEDGGHHCDGKLGSSLGLLESSVNHQLSDFWLKSDAPLIFKSIILVVQLVSSWTSKWLNVTCTCDLIVSTKILKISLFTKPTSPPPPPCPSFNRTDGFAFAVQYHFTPLSAARIGYYQLFFNDWGWLFWIGIRIRLSKYHS